MSQGENFFFAFLGKLDHKHETFSKEKFYNSFLSSYICIQMEPFHFTISFWSVLNFKIQYTFFVKNISEHFVLNQRTKSWILISSFHPLKKMERELSLCLAISSVENVIQTLLWINKTENKSSEIKTLPTWPGLFAQ